MLSVCTQVGLGAYKIHVHASFRFRLRLRLHLKLITVTVSFCLFTCAELAEQFVIVTLKPIPDLLIVLFLKVIAVRTEANKMELPRMHMGG